MTMDAVSESLVVAEDNDVVEMSLVLFGEEIGMDVLLLLLLLLILLLRWR